MFQSELQTHLQAVQFLSGVSLMCPVFEVYVSSVAYVRLCFQVCRWWDDIWPWQAVPMGSLIDDISNTLWGINIYIFDVFIQLYTINMHVYILLTALRMPLVKLSSCRYGRRLNETREFSVTSVLNVCSKAARLH